MQIVPYHGWGQCVRLANDSVELIIPTAVGLRIIHFSFIGGENEFATIPEHLGQTGGDEWRLYGGHRLWHAPEHPQRTYYPDNQPITVEEKEGFVRFSQATEPNTGIQKSIDIALAANGAQVTITHHLSNHGLWPVSLAPWALSVMAPGGTAVLPLPPRGSHAENLLPNTRLNLWAYTNMNDPRWQWGHQFVLLQQEPGNPVEQKVGATVTAGWVAYSRHGRCFVKTVALDPQATYPDAQSNVELYVCDNMLEVETLGPLQTLPPNGRVSHQETWYLLDNIPPIQSENDVQSQLLPQLQQLGLV